MFISGKLRTTVTPSRRIEVRCMAILIGSILLGTGTTFGQTPDWIWMGGSSSVDEHGVYNGLGQPGMPGARQRAVSWTDEAGDLWLFGGSGFGESGGAGNLNDLWRYHPATGVWTWMKGSNTVDQAGVYGTQGLAHEDNTPGGRQGAVSWTDEDGDLWLFGGFGRDGAGDDGVLNDLWRYDPEENEWTWMKGSNTVDQAGVYGTPGLAHEDNTPGGRWGAVSWTDEDGHLWLFGGQVLGFARLNDLWRYDPEENEWTWMKGSNIVNQSGIYGTLGLAHEDNTPGARNGAVSWTDADGYLWLFGGGGRDGNGNSGFLNDLWRYDPATDEWTWMKGSNIRNQDGEYGTQGTPDAANTPGGRQGAVSWTDEDGDRWLFGGLGRDGGGSGGVLNDLWRLYDICDDPDTRPDWDDGNITSNNDGSGYFIVDVPAGFLAVELVTADSENITLLDPYVYDEVSDMCVQTTDMNATGINRPPGIVDHAPGNTEWTYEGTDDITQVCIRIANEHAGESSFMVKIRDRCGRFLQVDPLIALSSDVAEFPSDFLLEANYPNPFNPSTTIRFHLPQSEHVTLTVYDVMGREVRQVVSARFEAGVHTAEWDARNDDGLPVSSGVYLYRIEAGAFVETRRMTVVK